MKYILSIIGSIISIAAYAQIDSSYIKVDEQQFAVKAYTAQNLFFINKTIGEDEVTYMANNPMAIGFGCAINNTILSFSYGYGFDFMRKKSYGETKSLDFQYHYYGRKFVADIFFQRYKGFYKDVDDAKDNEIVTLYPDMSVNMYGAFAQYIVNNKRFSYKAAFSQNERQKISAGSFLFGVGVYLTNISSDSSFVYRDKNHLRNFQFGINAGYAHTWVLNPKWNINASLSLGVNVGSEKINTFGKQKLEVYPMVFPRLSTGYNLDSWSLGFSFLSNVIFPSISEEDQVGMFSGGIQVSFIKRFDANIPFLKKK